MFDSFFRNFRNMNHSFFSRCKFDKCAKLFDAYNFSFKYLSSLKICHNRCNHLHRLVHLLCVNTTYRYRTFICDINLHTCLLNNCIDCLTTLSDNITNLCRINLHLTDLRCIRSNFRSWLFNCLCHYLI